MKRLSAGIEYELTYKRVKNVNLRVRADGSVCVSASRRVKTAFIDAFVAGRAQWIEAAKRRVCARESSRAEGSADECLALFTRVSDAVFPLFSGLLDKRPHLRVRRMTSRWGVCHYGKNTVVLSTLLASAPEPFIEYVLAHEYAHMLHHDHQAGFHSLMAHVMPDYKQRRKLALSPLALR